MVRNNFDILNSFTAEQLKEFCKHLNLKTSGKKEELQKRISTKLHDTPCNFDTSQSKNFDLPSNSSSPSSSSLFPSENSQLNSNQQINSTNSKYDFLFPKTIVDEVSFKNLKRKLILTFFF